MENHIKKTLFIVEDYQKNLKFFKAVLGSILEYEVIMEERGKIAFEKIKIQCPDLIILDIQLPEEWD
jgi:response regulator RpfG family c-di-GMP phosphodiesterase